MTNKKNILSLACLLLSFSSLLAQQKPSNEIKWEYVTSNELGAYFLSNKIIKTKEGTVKVWFKIVPRGKGDKTFTAARYEFNCEDETRKALGYVTYKEGQEPTAGKVKEEWEEVYPETIGYKLLIAACKKQGG